MQLTWRTPEFGPSIHTSLTTAEAKALRQLAQDRNVLEIGSAYGYSTVLMAEVAESVTSIDPHTGLGSLDAFRENLRAYSVADRVQIHVGRSQETLPTLESLFDLIFIDGDHEAATVALDFASARRLIRLGGVITAHDYGEVTCPGVAAALEPPTELIDTLALYR